MKKFLTVFLSVLIATNAFAYPGVVQITSTAPVTSGVYVDRHTDRALVFTSNSVSYVNWPSGTVLWSVTGSTCIYNVVNRTQSIGDNVYVPKRNVTENYFAILLPKLSQARALFTPTQLTIEVRFEPITRNGQIWLDVYWNRILDSFGAYGLLATESNGTRLIQYWKFHKSYVKQ